MQNIMKTQRLSTTMLFLALVTILVSACLPQAQASPPESLDYERFIEKLREAGHEVEEVGELDEPIFGERVRVIRLNGEDLQVYEFGSAAEQEAASATISGNGYIIGTNSIFWISKPYFYAKDTLIVLYLGVEEETIELLAEVLDRPLTGAEGVELRGRG
jgi:hypothetical protein